MVWGRSKFKTTGGRGLEWQLNTRLSEYIEPPCVRVTGVGSGFGARDMVAGGSSR